MIADISRLTSSIIRVRKIGKIRTSAPPSGHFQDFGAPPKSCPAPNKRTSPGTNVTSEKCQLRLSKFAATASGFGVKDCDSATFGVNFLRREIAQYSKGTGSRHSCGKD
jgi:hypothetical protein